LKEDVLKQLPKKIFIPFAVELDKDVQKEYDTINNEFAAYLKEYAGKQPAEIARTMQAHKLAQLNALRLTAAKGKIGAASDLIDSIVDQGEKVIVFCSFIDPLRKLAERYPGSVTITGETPIDQRQENVRRFQEDKDCQVFFGGVKSAGTGITLTAASNVIFLDYSWVPGDMAQAQDRAHRIGSVFESINIYQLYVENTIDEDMKEIIDTKQDLFNQLIDGKEAQDIGQNMMQQAVSKVFSRAKPSKKKE
jgi:SWI/SNF-related matrix-associated actin-dependent regulator 1 of chromatin subfamily A